MVYSDKHTRRWAEASKRAYRTDAEISKQFAVRGHKGSRVVQGKPLVIPVENSLLYVQPFYLVAIMNSYLTATAIIDSDHPSIKAYAAKILAGATDPVDCSIKLFLAVRDGIRYDPYTPFYLPGHYQASFVLGQGRGFCVPKASLLCALGRASGIPSRVGFATVRNHLATRQLLDFLGSDLFVYHGFVEFFLEGKWVKATPAFNAELCRLHRVPPLDFNGKDDAMLQAYNLEDRKFIEYVEDLGLYEDIPVDRILAAWKRFYGEERVRRWVRVFEEHGADRFRDFWKEEVLKG